MKVSQVFQTFTKPRPDPERDRTAYDLSIALDEGDISSQAEVVKMLRGRGELADYIADLLEPEGRDGWRLILKRNRRGPPLKGAAEVISDELDFEKMDGRRGAIKRLARKWKVSPEGIRSAARRWAGTHSKRRKKRGRK